MLVAQEKPLGKIYWAIGTQEYFAKGDPLTSPSAPFMVPVPGEPEAVRLHLQKCPCVLTGWPWSLHAWSAQPLNRGLTGDMLGAVCLVKEALTFPHRSGCQKQFETYSLPLPPVLSIPHKTEQRLP